MKVILNVSENWYRTYIVEIPDEVDRQAWDDEAVYLYLSWLKNGAPHDGSVEQLTDPEYIDDQASDTFFVTGRYDEDTIEASHSYTAQDTFGCTICGLKPEFHDV
jgi:hypothetical protein